MATVFTWLIICNVFIDFYSQRGRGAYARDETIYIVKMRGGGGGGGGGGGHNRGILQFVVVCMISIMILTLYINISRVCPEVVRSLAI